MISTELNRIIDSKGFIEQAVIRQGGCVAPGLITDYAEAVMAIKPDYKDSYPFTLECIKLDNGSSYICITSEGTPPSGKFFQYSLNESGRWFDLGINVNVKLKYGDRIAIRATGSTWSSGGSGRYVIHGVGVFNAYGSILSLINSPSASTSLSNNCFYNGIFSKGSNGIKVLTSPEFSSTNISAPSAVYRGFYYDFPSIIVGPDLPAATVGNYGYSYMFNGCTNLRYMKVLATSVSSTNAIKNMMNNGGGISSEGDFVVRTNAPSALKSAVPSGWKTHKNTY